MLIYVSWILTVLSTYTVFALNSHVECYECIFAICIFSRPIQGHRNDISHSIACVLPSSVQWSSTRSQIARVFVWSHACFCCARSHCGIVCQVFHSTLCVCSMFGAVVLIEWLSDDKNAEHCPNLVTHSFSAAKPYSWVSGTRCWWVSVFYPCWWCSLWLVADTIISRRSYFHGKLRSSSSFCDGCCRCRCRRALPAFLLCVGPSVRCCRHICIRMRAHTSNVYKFSISCVHYTNIYCASYSDRLDVFEFTVRSLKNKNNIKWPVNTPLLGTHTKYAQHLLYIHKPPMFPCTHNVVWMCDATNSNRTHILRLWIC